MRSYSGEFQAFRPGKSAPESGACQVTFDKKTFTITPTTGAPLAIDLGDIDSFTPGDYDLALTLFTGQRLALQKFGKSFANLSHDLLEAYRNRLLECLLLEDLEEVERYDGHAQLNSAASPERSFASPAELRLYRSNLAVLPMQATGTQWRLAEIDRVVFDESAYSVTLHAGPDTLVLTRLAKRTREFRERLEGGIAAISERAAQALHGLLPFLAPDPFRAAAAILREGRVASFSSLSAIHPKIEPALYENVVDSNLRPYCDALRARTIEGGAYTGFKFIREEAGDSEGDESSEGTVEVAGGAAGEPSKAATHEKESILHWFFFPLVDPAGRPANLVAWEAASRGGRATYFFRLVSPNHAQLLADPALERDSLDAAIRELNRALVLLNFRREPISLSDEKLEMQQRYRRYAIACRKLPELRRLRATFVGRALHTSLDAWQKQVDGFLPRG